jgi:uncharacterized surface protein with fasciclin (FAS1) repeats
MNISFKKLCLTGMACLSLLAAPTFASSQTITEIVAGSGGEFDRDSNDFDMLLNAVLAADLADVLADPNADFTVLAPDDRAFIRLARDLGYEGNDEAQAFDAIVTVLTVLGEGDPIPVLTNVLLYHVLPGAKDVREVRNADSLNTALLGETILPDRRGLMDNDPDFKDPRIQLSSSNIMASNGVIHGINRVLIPADLPNTPEGLPTITEIVLASSGDFDSNASDFDILLNAVVTAGLGDALGDPNSDLTVFAPTDFAFTRFAQSLGFRGRDEEDVFNFIVAALTELGNGDPIPVLTNVLLYHVSAESKFAKDVIESQSVMTLLDGATIEPDGVVLVDNDPRISNPKITLSKANIRASNGVIHPINGVLVPLRISASEGPRRLR